MCLPSDTKYAKKLVSAAVIGVVSRRCFASAKRSAFRRESIAVSR